jgi:hypothetical protein
METCNHYAVLDQSPPLDVLLKRWETRPGTITPTIPGPEKKACLIIGSVHYINGIHLPDYRENPGVAYFIHVELPRELVFGQQNTVYLTKAQLNRECTYTIRSGGGRVHARGRVVFSELFNDFLFNLRALETFNRERHFFNEEDALSLVPLFYISYSALPLQKNCQPAGELLTDLTCYSQLRFSETDFIFIKTGFNRELLLKTGPDRPIDPGDLGLETPLRYLDPSRCPILGQGINLHDQNALFLGNHQCYYRKIQSELEIEYKFNLQCPDRIWELNADLYARVKAGLLEGYILEYKDEFQKWDYHNHLFAVTAPEEEVGYISFIPRTNVNYNVKRKIYKQDALKRKELIQPNVRIEGSLEDYLSQHYTFQYKKYPPFRRVRYDINFESLQTGNVFGIFFDHVSVAGRPESLVQCEIEYLRTRSLFENQQHVEELNRIHAWTIEYFNEKKIKYEQTFYSKLSFLRDLFG